MTRIIYLNRNWDRKLAENQPEAINDFAIP